MERKDKEKIWIYGYKFSDFTKNSWRFGPVKTKLGIAGFGGLK